MRLLSGTVTVATAGTRQRFATAAQESLFLLVLKARAGNAGNFYVGDSSVTASAGLEIAPGEALTLELPRGNEAVLGDFYGDVATNGDQLDYLGFAR